MTWYTDVGRYLRFLVGLNSIVRCTIFVLVSWFRAARPRPRLYQTHNVTYGSVLLNRTKSLPLTETEQEHDISTIN